MYLSLKAPFVNIGTGTAHCSSHRKPLRLLVPFFEKTTLLKDPCCARKQKNHKQTNVRPLVVCGFSNSPCNTILTYFYSNISFGFCIVFRFYLRTIMSEAP